ncbi:MAG: tetratricopeptide repeat protein [Thermoleophilia bacterium]
MFDSDDGDRAYAHFRAGTGLLRGGNPAQGVVRLEKARRLAPDKSSISEALGRAYYAVGRWADAEAEFRTIIERCPSDDYAHYCLSRILRKTGRDEEAQTHLRLARAMKPQDPCYFSVSV